jgi:hypothetical protein
VNEFIAPAREIPSKQSASAAARGETLILLSFRSYRQREGGRDGMSRQVIMKVCGQEEESVQL